MFHAVLCCGSAQIRFISADPDPLHEADPGIKKSREIHIKIDQNYKNVLFFLKTSLFCLKHMNKLINNIKHRFKYYNLYSQLRRSCIFILGSVISQKGSADPDQNDTDPHHLFHWLIFKYLESVYINIFA